MNGVRGDTLSVCKGGRLVALRREKGVAIWRLGEVAPKGMRKQMEDEEMDDLVTAIGGVGGMDGVRGGWEKLLEMELKTGTNLLTSGLSEDGRWLAVSDLGETKLFRLRLDVSCSPYLFDPFAFIPTSSTDLLSSFFDDEQDPTRNPSAKRVRSLTPTLLAQCPPSLNLSRSGTGSSTLCFTPDSSKLILATALGGDIVVLDLSSLDSSEDGEGEAKVLRVFEQCLMGGGGKADGRTVVGKKNEAAGTTAAEEEEDGAMDVDGEEESLPSSSSKDKVPFATVSCMSVGHDGQYLAISDLLGRTRIYNLDTLQLHSHLPTFPHHPPSALAFLPNPNSLTTSLLLIAVPSGNQLHVYDIDKRRFPPHLNTPVPAEVRSLTDPVLGIAADASTASGTGSVLMWAGTWVCRVRLGGGGANSRKAIKKRKMAGLAVEGGGAEQSSGPKAMEMARFALSKDYRSLLGVQFVGEKELVLVERPWLDLVGTLPASYFKGGKYGT
jgi:U3 small nucleolar RNA-associated protein 4